MTGRIVVGVDGSAPSEEALAFAIEEARRRDATLAVVHAYMVPIAWAGLEVGMLTPMPDPQHLEEDARKVLDHVLEDAPDDVRIERVVVQAAASEALIDAAEDAELLVVGSRGHGGFYGLLLGSTSHQVVTHAPCPVTVVPHRE